MGDEGNRRYDQEQYDWEDTGNTEYGDLAEGPVPEERTVPERDADTEEMCVPEDTSLEAAAEIYHSRVRRRRTVRKRRRGHSGGAGVWVAAASLALLVLVCGAVLGTQIYLSRRQAQSSGEEPAKEAASRVQLKGSTEGADETGVQTGASVLDVSDVVAEVMPSVVAITNKSVQEVRYMFYGTMELENESSGSGFIIAENDEELLIATNYHVIEGAASLSVCFSTDEEEDTAAVVQAVEKGSDPEYDLAVVAVAIDDIPEEVRARISVASLGNSGDVRVGEPAIAIGNALGYGQSVTLGIISAVDRTLSIDGAENTYLQTDAAINFGNSGGALLNVSGEVVGINSAKAATSGVEGMGYAIPIDEARPVLEELANRETRTKAEESERGYLGVYVQDISSEAKMLYGIPDGICINGVVEGSAAESAGLRRGNIISEIDGNSISSVSRFTEVMEYYRSGDTVTVQILAADGSGYAKKEIEVTFGGYYGRSEAGRAQSG